MQDLETQPGEPRWRRPLCRRRFISTSSAAVGGLLLVSCGDDDDGDSASTPSPTQTAGQQGGASIDFADGDIAVVNFAYALEQLEAAFYAQVNDSPPSGFSRDARRTFEDIGAHELIHREFLKAVLGDAALPDLEVNFDAIDFSDAQSVLDTAVTFEDLGVGAYNGAAQFLSGDGDLGLAPLQAAGEIVSVEARHASAVHTLASGEMGTGSFAPEAFDMALLPMEVLEQAAPFIATPIELRNAPAQPAS